MPSMRVRWSESEARKPYARPFMVTFVSDDGTDVGSVALNGADLLYYTHFQTAVLSLAGELFVDTAVEASADPQRAWLDRVAGLIPALGEITITPKSTFDDHQGRVFRLVVTAEGTYGERRRGRPARIPGLPGRARASDRLPVPRHGDRGCRGRRRAPPRLDWARSAHAGPAPGRRRGDERGLALGVSGTAYERAVATLDAVAWRGIMPGLERTRALLAALGNPQTRAARRARRRHQRQGFGLRDRRFGLPRRRAPIGAAHQPAPAVVLRAHRARRRAASPNRVRRAGRHRA